MKKYTNEFIQQVLQDAENMKVVEVAKKYNIHSPMIYGWRKKIQLASFVNKPVKAVEAESMDHKISRYRVKALAIMADLEEKGIERPPFTLTEYAKKLIQEENNKPPDGGASQVPQPVVSS